VLLFIDDLRHIRIVRKTDSPPGREPLGRIRKQDGEISEEVIAKLDSAERAEVQSALALIRAGEQARLKTGVAELPALLRELVEFYRTDAQDFEKRWIRGAIQEANRLIRSHDNKVIESRAE
jgi:molecular chaperone DnaK (HSP70)